jgi:broad specificity phosphatase PhoE
MPTCEVYLIRHGETEWSRTGQHTGTTDLPLTPRGEDDARLLSPVLARHGYVLVLTSPLQRARRTCELAGLGAQASVDTDLMEWNYGEYEGLTTEQIQAVRPGWMLFRDGCPGGESPEQIAARVDRVIAKVKAAAGPAALFAHGHVFRVFAARWLALAPAAGAHFLLETATLSVLSADHAIPAIKRWNVPLPPATS